MSPATVVVTGAGGFIGSHLARFLAAEGVNVRTVHHRHAASADFVREIGPETDWSEVLAGADAVVHLAALVHRTDKPGGERLEDYRTVNTEGTDHLAAAAIAMGVKRLVFLSSAGVMGSSSRIPFTERDTPSPISPYAKSKLEAEQQLLMRRGDLEVVILRPPLVYGPGAPGNFGRLVGYLQRGRPVPMGTAPTRRSLLYVGNLTAAIAECLTHAAAAGEVFFVSDGEDVSLAELIGRLAQATGSSVRLLRLPGWMIRVAGRVAGRSEDADRLLLSFQIDSSKLRRTLDWSPPHRVAAGIEATFGAHQGG